MCEISVSSLSLWYYRELYQENMTHCIKYMRTLFFQWEIIQIILICIRIILSPSLYTRMSHYHFFLILRYVQMWNIFLKVNLKTRHNSSNTEIIWSLDFFKKILILYNRMFLTQLEIYSTLIFTSDYSVDPIKI